MTVTCSMHVCRGREPVRRDDGTMHYKSENQPLLHFPRQAAATG